MFEIKSNPIELNEIEKYCRDDRAGALVWFDGRVRNHNEGMEVRSLEYQCYPEMALKEGLKIVEEAKSLFNIHKAYCIHREGHLQIEESAVIVGVSSSHRKEGFEACQYIIDNVKQRVPIWKKEHYVTGPSEWVECHRCQSSHHA